MTIRFALSAAALALVPSAASAVVVVQTSPFVGWPIAANDFEQVSANVPNATPYTQGGITVRYVASGTGPNGFDPYYSFTTGPGYFDVSGGSAGWHAPGTGGYTSIKLANGASFNEFQFFVATSGATGTGLQYELLLGGTSVANGLAGPLLNWILERNPGRWYGFSGTTFDEVRVQAAAGATAFNPNSVRDTLNLDKISIGASAVASVPEPSTWLLLIGGFGLVGGVMRRRSVAFDCRTA